MDLVIHCAHWCQASLNFYDTLLTLFWLIDAVILIIDEAYISDNREMREGAD